MIHGPSVDESGVESDPIVRHQEFVVVKLLYNGSDKSLIFAPYAITMLIKAKNCWLSILRFDDCTEHYAIVGCKIRSLYVEVAGGNFSVRFSGFHIPS